MEKAENIYVIPCEFGWDDVGSRTYPDDVVVDIDQLGLIANSKTYELTDKGYFPIKRGKKDYQLSAVFTGKHSETAGFYFDQGNTH